MKRWMKVALATIIAALCVASLAMSVAGATPVGVAGGVNFANIDLQETVVKITPYSNGVAGTPQYYDVNYSPTMGGFYITGLSYYLNVGDVLLISFDIANEDGESVLKYCDGSRYYFSCGVAVTDNGYTHNLRQERIAFKNGETTQYAGNGTAYATLTHVAVSNVDISAVNRGNSAIFVDSLRVYAFTIYQETPIYNITRVNNTSHVEQAHVPFYESWFTPLETDFEDGYTAGYGKGYEQGAIDASGGPIQSWGAFLLTAVNGFMSFEIFPNFPLWGLLSVMVAIPLMVAFLKMFAGG